MPDPAAFALDRFHRLDEYFGAWAYEPDRFAALWALWRRTDLRAHAAEVRAAGGPQRPGLTEVVGVDGRNVAVVRVGGTLMKQWPSLGGTSTVALRQEIRRAAQDPAVAAVLLSVDSPGGTVAGVADLAAEVKAARRRKPVWAHVDDLAASAAYWVASQADQVWANSATALVGSVGTVMTVYDLSGAGEREGVRAVVFATGPLKGAGTPYAPVTEDQRAYFQAMVDDTQKAFDAAVRAGRGLSAEGLAAARTGGVFLADRAKEMGLIDGVRPLDATVAALARAK